MPRLQVALTALGNKLSGSLGQLDMMLLLGGNDELRRPFAMVSGTQGHSRLHGLRITLQSAATLPACQP